MIYEIARELVAVLREHRCPVPVGYGPETTKPTVIGASRVIVERARGRSTDTWITEATKTHVQEPKPTGQRTVPLKITIYASSNLSGAREPDHVRLMDQVVDVVYLAVREVLGKRRQSFRVTAGGMPNQAELDMVGMEQWIGAVYELTLAVNRTMTAIDWKGEGRPTIKIGEDLFENTTTVRQPGQSAGETACGGN